MNLKKLFKLGGIIMGALLFTSCAKEVSETTGWQYNSEKWGGFEKVQFFGQETGPGLTLIEGGSFCYGFYRCRCYKRMAFCS